MVEENLRDKFISLSAWYFSSKGTVDIFARPSPPYGPRKVLLKANLMGIGAEKLCLSSSVDITFERRNQYVLFLRLTLSEISHATEKFSRER